MRIQSPGPAVCGTIEMFTATSGSPSARVRTPDGRTVHLHSTVDPAAEHTFFPELTPWGDTIVLLGTGLGYHLDTFIPAIPVSTRVIAVDCFPQCLAQFRDRFSPQHADLHTVCGAAAPARVSELIAGTAGSIQIVKHPPSCAVAPACYEALLDRIFTQRQSANAPGRTRTLLVLRSSFFAESELVATFEQLEGIRCVPFDYRNHTQGPSFEDAFAQTIETTHPDGIVSINMLGFDGKGTVLEAARRRRIPLAVWFVDDPRPILLNQARFIDSSMTALCWERAYLPFLQTHGFGSVHYLPLATGFTTTVAAAPARYPLTFAATSMGGTFLEDIRHRFLWDPQLEPFVELGVEELCKHPCAAGTDFVTELSLRHDFRLPFNDERNCTWLAACIIHTASMRKRVSLVKNLVDMHLQVFGDHENWVRLCGSALAAFPPVAYPNGAHDLYRASAISLNATSCQMPTAVNQRVFDVPAAGGFLITDYQRDLEELFDCTQECVTYRSHHELRELIGRFAADERDRVRIGGAARRRIGEQHTYRHRARTIVDGMLPPVRTS